MKTLHKIKLLAGLLLVAPFVGPVLGETLVLNDSFTAADEDGFTDTTGVNKDITSRLTGSLAGSGLRYIHTVTTKLASQYGINGNSLRILKDPPTGQIGRFTFSANGSSPFDFGPTLGAANATKANPLVYDVRISMKNTATSGARLSFGLATEDGNIDAMDFGIQIHRASTSATVYTVSKRFDTASTGVADFTTSSPKIGTHGTAGQFINFLIRVTDAGAESGLDYNSRIQVSVNNGSAWIYDTATDTTDLPNGFRFDATSRMFVFDQAPNPSGDAYYDEFSVTLFPSKTWTGAGNANWANTPNWEGGAAPRDGDSLIFDGTAKAANNNIAATALTLVPSITFNNGGFTLQQNPLTVSRAMTNLAGNNTINFGLTLNNDINIRSSSGALTLGGILSGSGSIAKTGTGELILGTNNTYTGTTTNSEGTLTIGGGGIYGSIASTLIQNDAALVFNRSDALTYSGDIVGTGTLTKQGAGTLTLGGANTYNGLTTVSRGTLTANNIPGDITVEVDGTLAGSGTIPGAVSLSGTISPGSSAGTLTTSAQTWNTGGTYIWEGNNTASDLILATSLNIAGNSFTNDIRALEALTDWNNTVPTNWTIVETTSGITGFDAGKFNFVTTAFNSLNAMGAAGHFTMSSDGTDLVLNFNPIKAVADTGVRPAGAAVKINVLANDLINSGTKIISAFDSTTTNGSTVVNLGGGWLRYTPSGDPETDTFTYTLSDGVNTAVTTVTVVKDGTLVQARDLTSVTAGAGSFYGIPETSYTVEYADVLTEPVPWQSLTNVITSTNGFAAFADPEPSESQRYYRIVYP